MHVCRHALAEFKVTVLSPPCSVEFGALYVPVPIFWPNEFFGLMSLQLVGSFHVSVAPPH